MKNTLDSSNSILHTVISKFEYKTIETTQIKYRKKKKKRQAIVACGAMLSNLIYTCNWSLRGGEVERNRKKIFEKLIAPNFLNLMQAKTPQFQEA